MTDKHETPPRLSPPPKVGRERPGSRAAEASDRRARADRSLLYWLTGFVFLALAATAVAVFVFLPDWVPERTAATAIPESVPDSIPKSSELPIEETPASNEPEVRSAAPLVAPHAVDQPGVTPSPPQRPPSPQSRREPPAESPRPAASTASSSRSTNSKSTDTTEVAFGQAMTDGLSRLAAGELGDAEQAFWRALALRPDSPAAADGMARVGAERQDSTIALHRERAAAHEEQERWSEAVAEYAAVLALDPTIRFAQEGQAHAMTRRDLGEQLAAHIAHADRLSSDMVLEDAGSVLSEAQTIARPGPILDRQMERLAAQIRIAETTIRVVLLSDAETEVLVFKVGRLGAFERRTLDLRPGSYTVVGTRAGYRDVRRILKVAPGRTEISLTVRCKEKI